MSAVKKVYYTWPLQSLMCLIFRHGKHRSHVITFTWLKINHSFPFWEPISWRQVINEVCCRIPIKHRPVVINCSVASVPHTLVLIVYRLKWAQGGIMCWWVLKPRKWEGECDRKDVLQISSCSCWKIERVDTVSICYQCQHREGKLTVHCLVIRFAIYSRWGLLQEEANQ